MSRLEGQAAIVLGASGAGNIGQACARRLAREGVRVLVAGRRAEPLEELAREIGGAYLSVDARRPDDMHALAEKARAEFGGLHIAVNAVGQNLTRPLLETTRDDLVEIADVQFVAPFLFLQAMVGAMTEGGSIIHMSSISSRNMMRNHAAYMGTKAGFEHVVRAFAWEFGPKGIRVNCISPGPTRTPMTEQGFASSGFAEFRAGTLPLRRLGTTEDIAAAVAWLADPECFVTGENLQVNGGATLLAAPTMNG